MSVSAKTGYALPGASERRRRIFDFGMTAPGALASSVLVLFALGIVLFLGLRTNDGSLLGGGFTLSNFSAALSDPALRHGHIAIAGDRRLGHARDCRDGLSRRLLPRFSRRSNTAGCCSSS